MPINWELLKVPDIGKNTIEAFREGRKIRALRDFNANPDSQEPINALIELGETQQALSLHNLQSKRAEAARESQYRGAQARFFGDGTANALAYAGNPAPVPPSGQRNALAAFADPAPRFKQGLDLSPGQTPQSLATQVGNLEPEQQPHPLGQPQSPEDQAFMEMLRIDPKQALSMRSAMRDEAVKRLAVSNDANDYAISQLANVQDDQAYQTVLAEMDARLKPLGVDIRTVAPPQYPGPNGVRALLMKALGAKDQLAAIVSKDRLDAYVADLDADNTRADRNTDSLIDTRQAGVAETRRYHEAATATQRRGQDIRSTDTRRGQDIRSADTKRGQDTRGSGRKGGAQVTATGPDGKKVLWNGKAWVPFK